MTLGFGNWKVYTKWLTRLLAEIAKSGKAVSGKYCSAELEADAEIPEWSDEDFDQGGGFGEEESVFELGSKWDWEEKVEYEKPPQEFPAPTAGWSQAPSRCCDRKKKVERWLSPLKAVPVQDLPCHELEPLLFPSPHLVLCGPTHLWKGYLFIYRGFEFICNVIIILAITIFIC